MHFSLFLDMFMRKKRTRKLSFTGALSVSKKTFKSRKKWKVDEIFRHKICIQARSSGKTRKVDKLVDDKYNYSMIIFLLVGLLVHQSGDTIKFMEGDVLIDIIVLQTDEHEDNIGQKSIRRAGTSEDHQRYFIHETTYKDTKETERDEILYSKISFYDVEQNLLWEERAEPPRNISYDYSGIYGGLMFVTTWDKHCGNPAFFVVNDGEKIEIIEEDDWQQLMGFKISPNGQYLLFHTRNPYGGKTWDYLFFFDLSDRISWDYLFPICFSCKRGTVALSVDDRGRSEAVYKNEYRIFSKQGVLVDVFRKVN